MNDKEYGTEGRSISTFSFVSRRSPCFCRSLFSFRISARVLDPFSLHQLRSKKILHLEICPVTSSSPGPPPPPPWGNPGDCEMSIFFMTLLCSQTSTFLPKGTDFPKDNLNPVYVHTCTYLHDPKVTCFFFFPFHQ